MDQAHMIKDLEIAKRILSNLNNPIDGMMRIHIGQVISEAIDALKMVMTWFMVKMKQVFN